MENANHVYGLVGYRLAHSFSRNFFNEKFENEKIPAEYRNFELDRIEDLRLVVEETPELCGLNVTIPYKESIIPLLDEMDGTAQMIGAVNVVKVIHDKDKVVLKGYNSDIIGFTESIRPYIKEYHHKALILGTGGASKAVRYGLLSLGIEPQLVSRTAGEGVLTYDDLTPQLMGEYQIIVNATMQNLKHLSIIILVLNISQNFSSDRVTGMDYSTILFGQFLSVVGLTAVWQAYHHNKSGIHLRSTSDFTLEIVFEKLKQRLIQNIINIPIYRRNMLFHVFCLYRFHCRHIAACHLNSFIFAKTSKFDLF